MAVVTIARQIGSGGDEIAHAVARELNVPYVEKEILAAAAARLGITQAMAEGELVDRPLVHRLIGMLLRTPPGTLPEADESTWAMGGKGITGTGYRRVIEEVVAEVAAAGPAVIVGRAGQAILRDHLDAVHVFISAPHAERVARIRRERAISQAEAEGVLAASDAERGGYLRAEYGLDWQSPLLYSLSINTGLTAVGTATAAITAAARAVDVARAAPTDVGGQRLRQAVYTVAEAADLLLVSPEVIRHAIYANDLPATRLGQDLVLIQRGDLIAWMGRRVSLTS
jgi:excisionase family DNA binding protein